jgi:hypothetical protein
MVGFVISHSSLFGDVLKGNIDKRLPNVGMSANILITFYFWVGAALIFFSGIRHLWGSNVNKKKKK